MDLVMSVHLFTHLSDMRESVLPSAAKSNKPRFQSKVFVSNQWACVDNRVDLLLFQ